MMVNIHDERITGKIALGQPHTLKISTIDANYIAVFALQLTFRQIDNFTGMP
ncbi:hypothetical protein D3C79_1102880 [compost metagenome]